MVDKTDEAGTSYEAMFAALDEVETGIGEVVAGLPVADASPRDARLALREVARKLKLGDRAAAITHDLFEIVEEAARSGELDVNDALRLLPPVHRVREHDDKMAQMNNGGKPLPTIIWNIGVAGAISATVIPAAEVVDVADVVEPGGGLTDGAGEDEPHAQQSGMVFELFPVQVRAGTEGGEA